MKSRDVQAQPPLEPADQPYSLRSAETVAAGLPAVLSTARFTLQGPGLVKGISLLRVLNQAQGVDCASCAWPEPTDQRSLAEFCENGAKAMADEGTRRRVDADFFARYSVEELSRQSDYWLNQQGRLCEPMWLAEGEVHYQPISWDRALDTLGQRLKALPSPQRAAFYTSGRTSNEAAFLYQLLVRRFGTNNLPDCANMCHESSGVGLAGTVGVGKGTVQLEDFYQADLIVLIGQNPGTNHPRMLSTLEKARRGGARLVSINPLAEAALVAFKNPQDFMNPLKAAATLFGSGTPMADLHLPVRINGDVALLQWACRRLLELGKVDRAFIAEHTRGFEEFQAALAAEDPGELLEQCGIQPEQAEALVEALASTQKIIFCWAMGLTQHVNAVDNIQALVNLCLLRGALGRPGAGLCPVRGHSNVQGDRTMGITCHPKPAFLDALGQRFQFSPPREPGLDTVDSIRAMRAGQLDVLVCLGGNFLSATPDTEACAEGLRRLDLSVQISTKLNRSHLVTGREALILPCLGRSEIDLQAGRPQFVSVENSMGIVHSSQGRARPASPHLRSEVAIVCGLVQRLLGVDWSVYQHDYDRIRSEIEATIPGFQDYNVRVRQPEGFTLPNPVRQGGFGTRDGKAHFTALKAPDLRLPPQHYWMMTIRTHDQFNTTVYGMEDRYRGISGRRRVILMHPADAEAEGLRSGELVDLISHFQGQQRVARAFLVITYDIPPGCTATYFPEANALVPLDQVARGSNTPASKSVVISLRRSTHAPEVRAE